jgi:hypothetical protein
MVANASADLHGEVVTWDHPKSEVAYTAVLDSLRAADLPLDSAPELQPRSAFTRACKSLKENRQIDKVSDDKDTRERKFQLTKLDRSNGHIGFDLECFVYLNLDTGVIRCDNPAIEKQARELFQQAMGVRTSSDVTKIVQSYFKSNGDLFPLNRKGVAYFVPQRFAEFTAKIEHFFTTLGGTFGRFPVPKGTAVGNQSVKDAVDNGLATMASELQAAVDSWDHTTRESTMEKAVERWQSISFKVDAYAEYLEASQGNLRDTLTAAKAALAAKIESVGKMKEEAKERKQAEKESGGDAPTPLLDAIETVESMAEETTDDSFPMFA